MTGSYAVRHLEPGDIGLFRQLLAVFGEAFEDMETYTAAQPDDAYLDALLAGDSVVALVTLHDEAVIGGLVAYELKKFERKRSELYVYDLAVVEHHRRRGIATALFDHLKSIAAERGAWVIFVQADRSDPPAAALYSGLGRREEVLHFDIDVAPTASNPN